MVVDEGSDRIKAPGKVDQENHETDKCLETNTVSLYSHGSFVYCFDNYDSLHCSGHMVLL